MSAFQTTQESPCYVQNNTWDGDKQKPSSAVAESLTRPTDTRAEPGPQGRPTAHPTRCLPSPRCAETSSTRAHWHRLHVLRGHQVVPVSPCCVSAHVPQGWASSGCAGGSCWPRVCLKAPTLSSRIVSDRRSDLDCVAAQHWVQDCLTSRVPWESEPGLI